MGNDPAGDIAATSAVAFKQSPLSVAPALTASLILVTVVLSAGPMAWRITAAGLGLGLLGASIVALRSTLTISGKTLTYSSLVRLWSVDVAGVSSVDAHSGGVVLRAGGRTRRLPVIDYRDNTRLAGLLLEAVPAGALSDQARTLLEGLSRP